MPRLSSVTVTYGPNLEACFVTTKRVLDACDTAVLQIAETDRGGSELSIRVERGQISDVHLWDASRLVRQRLPEGEVIVADSVIRCLIPVALTPRAHGTPHLEAALVVNGARVQSRFPVRFVWRDQSSAAEALTTVAH